MFPVYLKPAGRRVLLVGGGLRHPLSSVLPRKFKIAFEEGEALERLTALYTERRVPGESARTFFRRVELPVAKAALARLERLAPEAASPAGFVDLGEDHAFTPEVMDGECSA